MYISNTIKCNIPIHSSLYSLIAGCGHDEFVPMYGTSQGPALKILYHTTMAHCAEKCSTDQACLSFEWIPDQEQCELNKARIPVGKATIGVVFCSRTGKGKNKIKSNVNYFILIRYFLSKLQTF